MNEVGENKIWSYLTSPQTGAQLVKRSTEVRQSDGHQVESFMELATKVADLQFRNRDLVLMFRGQTCDYGNMKGNTSLKASLFRPERGSNRPPGAGLLMERFDKLQQAETHLERLYLAANLPGKDRIQRYRILRWAILQHYEICSAPLLDVTHSLRVACSFATMNVNPRARKDCFLFVLGVPNLAGAITASAEAGLQIIRLSSVCPPSALRPHFQEGYLLGEYPELVNYDQKKLLEHHEIDFGLRLIAKFRFKPGKLWVDRNFQPVPKTALYPTHSEDPLRFIADQVAELVRSPR
jgi:hypothetical protein